MKTLLITGLTTLLLLSTSTTNASLSWNSNTADGVQVGSSFRGMTRASGKQSNILFGAYTIAAGYDLTCEDSITSHAQHSLSNLVPLIVQSVFVARTDPQSGWDSWEPGSTHQCNLNWKHLIKDGSGFGFSGVGVSISLGGEELSRAGTFFGFMTKPIEELFEEEVIACVTDADGEGDNLCGDPVMVDLNNDGFSFTSLVDGVLFDIDADGEDELTSWTQYHGDDAFLFLDLNENGSVDNGSELFGDKTKLLSGEFAIDGYEALAELDQAGWDGNGDQVIDRRDKYFKLLGLWNDWNQNGLSEPNELIKLSKTKIKFLSLELDYFDVLDEHGNWIEFASWAYTKSKPDNPNQTTYRTADVYLRNQELDH
jgi:hypothetical protein